ncbi:endonuclease domain-containing protein [Patescibacteria group bacterium]|nr:endonuclease domain-containing protein [Patescibacteria group bacterium]
MKGCYDDEIKNYAILTNLLLIFLYLDYLFNSPEFRERRRKLRSESPKAEIILWGELKNKQVEGLKFIRQYGVGPYVIDFFCPALKLAIEVDGDSHFQEGAEEYDRRRQRFIERFNIHFLRFTNTDIYENLDGVVEELIYVAGGLKNN